uniref:WW domain-containing protein n=1 Tax=Amazona collaria TaxID=241587 RepID=A0A8B9FEA6_9PSIT
MSPQAQPEPEEPPAPIYLNLQELREAAAAASAPEEPISSISDWETHTDTDTGHLFYYNPVTGETTWDCPFGQAGDGVSPLASPASSLAHSPRCSEWEQHMDEGSGQAFFYNWVTGETSWDPPDTGGARDRHPGGTRYGAMEQRVSTRQRRVMAMGMEVEMRRQRWRLGWRRGWSQGQDWRWRRWSWGSPHLGWSWLGDEDAFGRTQDLDLALLSSHPLQKRIIPSCLRTSWRVIPSTSRQWAPMIRRQLSACPQGAPRSWAQPQAGLGAATPRGAYSAPSTSPPTRYGMGTGMGGNEDGYMGRDGNRNGDEDGDGDRAGDRGVCRVEHPQWPHRERALGAGVQGPAPISHEHHPPLPGAVGPPSPGQQQLQPGQWGPHRAAGAGAQGAEGG